MSLFTLKELQIIYERARCRKTVDEMCLLVYMMMTTTLKMCDLLGWFNRDRMKRRKCLQDLKILEEYELIRILFPKKHQTYLLQWKKACHLWIGRKDVTFEMLRRSCKQVKYNLF